jgi:hypothetical protein
MANLINMSSGPDVVPDPQCHGHLNKFEKRAINYVIPRNVSAAVKSTSDDVVLNVQATAYRFTHPVALQDDIVVLKNDRLLSLCLGYDYPYLQKEQPRQFRHLSLDIVIPFLYRWKKQLLPKENHSEAPATLREHLDGTILETLIYQSHLFQAVCAKVYNEKMIPDPEGVVAMDAKIENWYTKWICSDTQSEQALRNDVLMFLLECRYEQTGDNVLKEEVRQLNKQVTEWKSLKGYLGSFNQFIQNHGDDLLGKNGEAAKNGKLAFRPTRPTVYTDISPHDTTQAPTRVRPKESLWVGKNIAARRLRGGC